MSDRAPEEFIEVELHVANGDALVIGRTCIKRGGRDPLVEEHPLAAGKAISDLTENDVTAFLVKEIPRLVARH